MAKNKTFFAALPLPCIILNANRRIKSGEVWEQGYHTKYTSGHLQQITVSTLDKAPTLDTRAV